jgi:hypothetical protein
MQNTICRAGRARARAIAVQKRKLVVVTYYSNLLHKTAFGAAMGGGIPWLWPAFDTLHFFGMVLLMGCVGVIDLRMLGVAKNLPLGPLQRLVPWGLFGFAINLITGIGFYAGNPAQYQSWAFVAKMAFVVSAGVNVLLFYVTGLYHRVSTVTAGQDVPFAAKLLAATSLFFWVGVMFWGRMLPFYRGN